MQPIKKKFSTMNLLLIIIALAGFGLAGYLLYHNDKTRYFADRDNETSMPPVFLYLEPFTVTLPERRNNNIINKVLYIGMVLRVANEEQKKIIMEYLPEVRSQLLLLLANQNIHELNTDEGKLKLISLVKLMLSRQYNKKLVANIDDVLFTDFIIR